MAPGPPALLPPARLPPRQPAAGAAWHARSRGARSPSSPGQRRWARWRASPTPLGAPASPRGPPGRRAQHGLLLAAPPRPRPPPRQKRHRPRSRARRRQQGRQRRPSSCSHGSRATLRRAAQRAPRGCRRRPPPGWTAWPGRAGTPQRRLKQVWEGGWLAWVLDCFKGALAAGRQLCCSGSKIKPTSSLTYSQFAPAPTHTSYTSL